MSSRQRPEDGTGRTPAQRAASRDAAASLRAALQAASGIPSGSLERMAGSSAVRVLSVEAGGEPAVLLSVRGEVDLASTPVVREMLMPVLRDRAGTVVLDLSEVTFMDSSGVQVLVEAHRELDAQQRRLAVVCRPSGQVHRLLGLVGMLDTLTVHSSRQSALIGGDELIRA